jgi:ribosome-associated heat shock protein Hsp15
MADARIDKWLWAVRIFKTRTIASDACKKGRVTISGQQVKSSHSVKGGDVIQVRKSPIIYSFRVIQPIEKRVGAKLVKEYMENVTTPDQYEILEMARIGGFVDRAKGLGRPTKKDRRELENFAEPDEFDFDWDDNDDK